MTWAQWKAACQLVAEERIGAPMRAKHRAEQEAEDAQVEATKAAIRQTQGV